MQAQQTMLKTYRRMKAVKTAGNSTACPLCGADAARSRRPEELCETCLDLLEFGYASFPAYRLEDNRLKEDFVHMLPSAAGGC
ncbi:hypothetical protein ACP26L_13075 [Paenibacillus sp. S-38]|uniref:hypothetical protein n=1 Tax=Paenibacillus sp. S-38 TaxID=3416710 RepID=UPI003CF12D91